MLQKAMDGITEFHYKHGFVVGTTLAEENKRASKFAKLFLWLIGFLILWLSKKILKRAMIWQEQRKDCRLWRTHLMLEELGETILAMSRLDETAYADGLGDLTYVVLGAAVSDDIPLSEIFEEIQWANMQKEPRNKLVDARLRNKGKNWKKPDIAGILQAYRKFPLHTKVRTLTKIEYEGAVCGRPKKDNFHDVILIPVSIFNNNIEDYMDSSSFAVEELQRC